MYHNATHQKAIVTSNNSTHLLQVWNKKGIMVFQRAFNMTEDHLGISEYPVRAWNIYQSHFVYTLNKNMNLSEYIYVVELAGAEVAATKPLKEIRIRKSPA